MTVDVSDESTRHLRAQIVARLKARGLHQADLAKHVGKSNTWISQLLRGQRGLPLNELDPIAHFFGVSPGQLLEDPTRLDMFDPSPPREEAVAHVVSTSHLHERQKALVERLQSLEYLLAGLGSSRTFLEYLETNVRQLVADAKSIRAAAHLDTDRLSPGRDRARARKPRARPHPIHAASGK